MAKSRLAIGAHSTLPAKNAIDATNKTKVRTSVLVVYLPKPLVLVLKIPIIATGGVNSGRDALEIMMAGGTLVGVGTAIYYHGDDFWKQATDEMSAWLDQEGVQNIEDIIGLFHKI